MKHNHCVRPDSVGYCVYYQKEGTSKIQFHEDCFDKEVD